MAADNLDNILDGLGDAEKPAEGRDSDGSRPGAPAEKVR